MLVIMNLDQPLVYNFLFCEFDVQILKGIFRIYYS